MDQPSALEPLFIQIVRSETHARAALRGHRALAIWTDEDRNRPCGLGGPHRTNVDPGGLVAALKSDQLLAPFIR